jgi:outer membrane protein assembly factor BamB
VCALNLSTTQGDKPDRSDFSVGSVKWKTALPDDTPSHSTKPFGIGSEHVYVPTHKGVSAFNKQDGSLSWSYHVGELVKTSPAVADGCVYVGTDDSTIVSITKNGNENWKQDADGWVRGGIALAQPHGTVVTGTQSGSAYFLDRSTGEIDWKHEAGGWVTQKPAVHKDLAFVGTLDGDLIALKMLNRQKKWTATLPHSVWTEPAVCGSTVCIGDADKQFYAYDIATGEELWNRSLSFSGFVDRSPMRLLAGSDRFYLFVHHRIEAVDRQTGKTLWSVQSRGDWKTEVNENQVLIPAVQRCTESNCDQHTIAKHQL